MTKKNGIGRTRKKKSITRTTKADDKAGKAKRLKTEATAVSDVKNNLVSAKKEMIDGMNEEHLYSVMVYVGALG